jgi:hypothetical protein
VAKPIVLFRVDFGFDPERGYAASIFDAQADRYKGVRSNSMRELCRLVHQAVCEAEQNRRRFPLEMEREEKRIITNGF